MNVVLLLTLTALLWGASPILDKMALARSTPEVGIFIRSIAINIVALAVMVLSGKTSAVINTDARTTFLFSISGLMAGFAAMFIYFMALRLGPASKIIPLAAAYPLVTMILAFLILKEGLSWEKVAGTILIIAGIWLIKMRTPLVQ